MKRVRRKKRTKEKRENRKLNLKEKIYLKQGLHQPLILKRKEMKESFRLLMGGICSKANQHEKEATDRKCKQEEQMETEHQNNM